jgi:hypothetical protein
VIAQPSDIEAIWTSENSFKTVQGLLLEYFTEVREKKGVDL